MTNSANSFLQRFSLPEGGIDLQFRKIPGGTFMMGDCSRSSPEPDTRPAHHVEVDAFSCAIHPITNAQYSAFVFATGYRTRREDVQDERFCWSDFKEYKNHPVIAINWIDAAAFCHWAGLRLLTEAEWEYAARGGLAGKEYPWGDEAPGDRCNWRSASHRPDMIPLSDWGGPTPVESYPANGWGLFDMSGNVWEWVSDAYRPDYYKKSPESNPSGPESDYCGTASPKPDWSLPAGGGSPSVYRVSRGGCWENQDFGLRVCERIFARAGTINKPQVSGFRCALLSGGDGR